MHAPELWIALDLGDPVDADVSEPGTPELVWSFARELVDGGRSYRTRIRMTARVAFDWIDWPDDDNEGSYQDLDITAWYTVDDEGFHIDQDRTNLQPAPVYTPPRRTEDTSTLTSTAFSLWREQQAATLAAVRALGTPSDIAALSAELARRAAAGINIVTPGTIAAMNVELARHAGVGIKAAAALNSAALGAELSRQVIDAGRAAQLGSELSRVRPPASTAPHSVAKSPVAPLRRCAPPRAARKPLRRPKRTISSPVSRVLTQATFRRSDCAIRRQHKCSPELDEQRECR